MVSINYSSREVCCKIVYYGPGLSGKTTNLQYVHSKVPSSTRGKLISLATESDRTLYFDFLPINIGTINGFAAKFQLYTVPGQVYYNATRKLVLRGVDGIVFVADSQPDKMEENIESLVNLEENLREYGYDINDLPLVIQYNKRDLPGVLTVEQLNARLNDRDWRFFEASATVGNGVFDTLKLIIKLVLDKAKSSSTRPAHSATAEHRVPVAAAPSAAPAGPLTTSESELERQPAAVASATSPALSGQDAPGPTPTTDTSPDQAADTPASDNSTAPALRQFRPYPGGDEKETISRKASSRTLSPVHRDEPGSESIERKAMRPDSVDDGDSSSKVRVPGMAPSVRRRSHKRRRGFFKRLFGIK